MKFTDIEIKNFYETFYEINQIRNPAFEIYDDLRIKRIESYIEDREECILIIGCGSHNDFKLIQKLPNLVAFDISYNAIKKSHEELSVVNADALFMPFADNSFDLIICSEVLEHIPKINLAISEISRVLQPKGNLIASTPNWISLFGLTRVFAELFTKKMISSNNQPYDDWKTRLKLKKELFPKIKIDKAKGVWYLPPLHFREKGLSKPITKIIYHLFSPFEALFSHIFPYFGHIIIIKCSNCKS